MQLLPIQGHVRLTLRLPPQFLSVFMSPKVTLSYASRLILNCPDHMRTLPPSPTPRQFSTVGSDSSLSSDNFQSPVSSMGGDQPELLGIEREAGTLDSETLGRSKNGEKTTAKGIGSLRRSTRLGKSSLVRVKNL